MPRLLIFSTIIVLIILGALAPLYIFYFTEKNDPYIANTLKGRWFGTFQGRWRYDSDDDPGLQKAEQHLSKAAIERLKNRASLEAEATFQTIFIDNNTVQFQRVVTLETPTGLEGVDVIGPQLFEFIIVGNDPENFYLQLKDGLKYKAKINGTTLILENQTITPNVLTFKKW